MKTVKRAELGNLRMVAGNEKKYPVAVIEGHVRRWVGIGWVIEREVTQQDLETLPVAED